MKIGICSSELSRIKYFHSIGYDFVELNNVVMYGKSEEELSTFLDFKRVCREGFFYSANGVMPSDIRLTGEGVDFDIIRDYAEKSFARLALLGVKMIVFGSGKAKQVPEDFSREAAMAQLVEITRIFSDVAAGHGMRVCIEPLNRRECNIINTPAEACALAALAGRENVGGHIDYYHMMQNGELMSDITPLASQLIHTHIASPCVRGVVARNDGADYRSFFDALRRGGYNETVAYEGRGSISDSDSLDMLEYLRSL